MENNTSKDLNIINDSRNNNYEMPKLEQTVNISNAEHNTAALVDTVDSQQCMSSNEALINNRSSGDIVTGAKFPKDICSASLNSMNNQQNASSFLINSKNISSTVSSIPNKTQVIQNNISKQTCINIPGYGMMKGSLEKTSNGRMFFVTTNPDGSPLIFSIILNDKNSFCFINTSKIPQLSSYNMIPTSLMASSSVTSSSSNINSNKNNDPQSIYMNSQVTPNSNNNNVQLPKLEAVRQLPPPPSFTKLLSSRNTPLLKQSDMNLNTDSLAKFHNFINNGFLDVNKPIHTCDQASTVKSKLNNPLIDFFPKEKTNNANMVQTNNLPALKSHFNINPLPFTSHTNVHLNNKDAPFLNYSSNAVLPNLSAFFPSNSQIPMTQQINSQPSTSSFISDSTNKTKNNKFENNNNKNTSDPTSHPGWIKYWNSFKKLKGKKIKGGEANIIKVAKRKWKLLSNDEKNFFANNTKRSQKNSDVNFQQCNCANPGCNEFAESSVDRGAFYCSDNCLIAHCEKVFKEWVSNCSTPTVTADSTTNTFSH